jgi:hypothetical protein
MARPKDQRKEARLSVSFDPGPPQETRERDFRAPATQLLRDVAEVTAGSSNEQNLRYGIEASLERQCDKLRIPWTPYQLDRPVRGEDGAIGFVDVVHGALIIEYEPPRCFGAGRSAARVQHAKDQAVDYAARMALEEGRPVGEYLLVVWDERISLLVISVPAHRVGSAYSHSTKSRQSASWVSYTTKDALSFTPRFFVSLLGRSRRLAPNLSRNCFELSA